VSSHGGSTDNTGGHNNRKTGAYHCHNEPCLTNHRKSTEAYQEAEQTNRSFSKLYDRTNWPHWVDIDKDCQDTRAEILISSSFSSVVFKSDKRCSVISGRWTDPYSHKVFTKASDLDIDHIVTLKNAHETGGSNWSTAEKRQFANDPMNLIAVEDNLNQSKGARSPDKWMPPDEGYWCEYVRRWVKVKSKYGLIMLKKENAKVLAIESSCRAVSSAINVYQAI